MRIEGNIALNIFPHKAHGRGDSDDFVGIPHASRVALFGKPWPNPLSRHANPLEAKKAPFVVNGSLPQYVRATGGSC
jgi:hypothetical protein